MPPLKPGKVVSQTGKVVNAPKTTPRGGPGAKMAPKPTPTGGPGSKIQKTGSLSTSNTSKTYKEAGSNFKGARVDAYLDKDGKVKDFGTSINLSSGPSGSPPPLVDKSAGTTPQMPPTPEPVAPVTPAPVKTPTRNITNIADLVPQFDPEYIKQILFENLSAVELSRIERHDTIEGINQRYSIVSNLSEIRKKYEITKQLTVMDKFKPLTNIFTINIEDKIPKEDYIQLEGLDSTYQYLDENDEIITREKGYFYIDTNGDLVIELINLERSQQVEIQIDTNGTIYKVES